MIDNHLRINVKKLEISPVFEIINHLGKKFYSRTVCVTLPNDQIRFFTFDAEERDMLMKQSSTV